MGPYQTYKLLHSKGNHKQNKKTGYGLGEDICKRCDWQGLNSYNIQASHTAQYIKTNQKQKQKPTHSKSGQKI